MKNKKSESDVDTAGTCLDDGWTFIETLIVIGIIFILSSSVGFMAVRYLDKAKTVSARSQIETYSLALDAYYLDCGTYPSADQGLESLWEKPTSSPEPEHWDGPYVNKPISKDPWGNPYQYNVPGPNGLSVGIRTLGADGTEGGEGVNADVTSWE